MASITFWNRLEPRPRTNSIAESLAARIHDPLWMLTRQWQFGEFRGEDAGSPAFVELAGRFSRLSAWETDRLQAQPLPAMPLEKVAEGEARKTDLALRIELGQTFETLLADAGVGDLASAFRAAFPIVPPAQPPRLDPADRDAAELLAVCAQGAIDGITLLQEAQGPEVKIPAAVNVPPSLVTAVRRALQQLFDWARTVHGAFGVADAPAWKPERLEYQFRVRGDASDPTALAVRPTKGGELDWFSFDVRAAPAGQTPAGPHPGAFRRSILPTHVRFRGMPNARFWDFESATTDFGDVRPDTRDVAKLLLVDFMLIQSNDWFIVPLEQPVGTFCRTEPLIVHDVFGGLTVIPRADTTQAGAGPAWTMFSSSVEGAAGSVAGIFVVPPTAASATLSGPAVEEVAFVRDDLSQLVWAVERAVEGATGRPLSGYERDAARSALAAPKASVPASDAAGMLRYRIQDRVPIHWIPFVPVLTDSTSGAIALERSALLAAAPGQVPTPIEPAGRILRPAALGAARYRVNEEEIPRAGVHVSRVIQRARWKDGTTRLWVARRKSYGRGERTTPLRFDVAAE